jgi:hypothetical protein
MIHGTPVPPISDLYILDSCFSGLFRATAGSILIATSLPATVCTPRNTVPATNTINIHELNYGDRSVRTTAAIGNLLLESVLASKGRVVGGHGRDTRRNRPFLGFNNFNRVH